jgi:guanylate kinase
MLVLSAPSGAGKTTLSRRLVADTPDARFSISATTRAPRGRERDGIDYRFLEPDAFRAMIEGGELLEWAEVHGCLYGTPRSFADEAKAGKLVLFDIDVQGGEQIKAAHPEAATLFILPPSLSELERRLRSRGTEPEAAVRRRLDAARAEIAEGIRRYDYLVINDRFDVAYAQIAALVRTLRGVGTPADLQIERSLHRTNSAAKAEELARAFTPYGAAGDGKVEESKRTP